jgi:hypothetical protein
MVSPESGNQSINHRSDIALIYQRYSLGGAGSTGFAAVRPLTSASFAAHKAKPLTLPRRDSGRSCAALRPFRHRPFYYWGILCCKRPRAGWATACQRGSANDGLQDHRNPCWGCDHVHAPKLVRDALVCLHSLGSYRLPRCPLYWMGDQ